MNADTARALLAEGDLLQLGRAADARRRQLHPAGMATFIIDRNINYTNICTSECRFCAFYRKPGVGEGYVLTTEQILAKVAETEAAGGTQVMLQGGLHPELGIAYYEQVFRAIRDRYPQIAVHSLSPAEILHIAEQECMPVSGVLQRLRAAGLSSLPGGGAEILVDEVRQQVSPKKIKAQDWLDIMETAQLLGVGTTATMVIGMGETIKQRVEHFDKIRQLQDRTGGFRAFILWTYQPGNTELGGEKTTAWEYLRTLAIARLYMDNIQHIQGSWVTQGQTIGQLTLAFGADDLGSIMLEENVVKAAGTAHRMDVQQMLALIRAAGRIPAQRNTQYEIIREFAG